jgi:hypothetical protein
MNRQRLVTLFAATAVLAGVLGIFGGQHQALSRSWADGPSAGSSVSYSALPAVSAKPGRTYELLGRTWS